jgi:rare lipoprotein A
MPVAHRLPVVFALTFFALLSGCAGHGDRPDDDEIPADIARIPDAVPRVEPLSRFGNAESYVVLGKRYQTRPSSRGYVERGLASWYGEPFHGRKTSSGEIYNMHGMSAAHKTLPLPTYARVTNVENGRSVVIRINDRGPFHGPRLIDLSHTAAVKLGVVKTGTAMVEVRAIDPKRPQSDPGPFFAAPTQSKTAAGAVAQVNPPPSRPASVSARRTDPPASSWPTPDLREREDAPAPVTAVASSERATTHGAPIYLQIGAFGDPQNAERLRERLTTRLSDRIRILTPEATGAALYKVRVGPLDSEHDVARLTRQLAALGVDHPQRVRN